MTSTVSAHAHYKMQYTTWTIIHIYCIAVFITYTSILLRTRYYVRYNQSFNTVESNALQILYQLLYKATVLN